MKEGRGMGILSEGGEGGEGAFERRGKGADE